MAFRELTAQPLLGDPLRSKGGLPGAAWAPDGVNAIPHCQRCAVGPMIGSDCPLPDSKLRVCNPALMARATLLGPARRRHRGNKVARILRY